MRLGLAFHIFLHAIGCGWQIRLLRFISVASLNIILHRTCRQAGGAGLDRGHADFVMDLATAPPAIPLHCRLLGRLYFCPTVARGNKHQAGEKEKKAVRGEGENVYRAR